MKKIFPSSQYKIKIEIMETTCLARISFFFT